MIIVQNCASLLLCIFLRCKLWLNGFLGNIFKDELWLLQQFSRITLFQVTTDSCSLHFWSDVPTSLLVEQNASCACPQLSIAWPGMHFGACWLVQRQFCSPSPIQFSWVLIWCGEKNCSSGEEGGAGVVEDAMQCWAGERRGATGCIFSLVPARKVLSMELVPPIEKNDY